jgi:Fe-S cluster biogenesis protein NfuA
MTTRTTDEIVTQIKELIETQVKPAVAHHGGNIEFVSYDDGNLLLELGGACSGCAGSKMTLKMGVENMLRHFVPEIQTVESIDDPFSEVDPFYTDPFMFDDVEMIDITDLSEDQDDSNS